MRHNAKFTSENQTTIIAISPMQAVFVCGAVLAPEQMPIARMFHFFRIKSMVAISGDMEYQHLSFGCFAQFILHNVSAPIDIYVKCNYRRSNAQSKLIRFHFFFRVFLVVCGQTIGIPISLENEENGTILFFFVAFISGKINFGSFL